MFYFNILYLMQMFLAKFTHAPLGGHSPGNVRIYGKKNKTKHFVKNLC